MKVGDKIICIKTREALVSTLNTKGKIYKITKIIDGTISTTCNKSIYHIRSHFLLSGERKNAYIFSEYFITEKEIRLKKLKKFNENC